MSLGSVYILRNITGRDINLGDLRIKIPAGKCRNLLGKKSRVLPEDIKESEKNGSISKYLGKFLIKVEKIVEPSIPIEEVADPSAVTFPQRKKSSIIIEVGEIDEEIKDLILEEDEEYLKQLEVESMDEDSGLPITTDEK